MVRKQQGQALSSKPWSLRTTIPAFISYWLYGVSKLLAFILLLWW